MNQRRHPAALLPLLALASVGTLGLGGSGRPDFEPSPYYPPKEPPLEPGEKSPRYFAQLIFRKAKRPLKERQERRRKRKQRRLR